MIFAPSAEKPAVPLAEFKEMVIVMETKEIIGHCWDYWSSQKVAVDRTSDRFTLCLFVDTVIVLTRVFMQHN